MRRILLTCLLMMTGLLSAQERRKPEGYEEQAARSAKYY